MNLLKDTIQIVELPAGFTTRPAAMEDAEKVVAMYNEYSKELMGVENYRLSDTLAEWSLPGTSTGRNYAPGLCAGRKAGGIWGVVGHC